MTEAQKHVPLRFYLFNLMVNSCLSTLGNMPPSTTHKKTTHIQAYRHPNLQSHGQSRREREWGNAETLSKICWLNIMKSSWQVCTLIEVQLKLNLKPAKWQRVKYKMLLLLPFHFFSLHKLFQKNKKSEKKKEKVDLPDQILHHPVLTLPSQYNVSQRELQYNTGTGENTIRETSGEDESLLFSNRSIQRLPESNFNSHPPLLNKNKDKINRLFTVFFLCFTVLVSVRT